MPYFYSNIFIFLLYGTCTYAIHVESAPPWPQRAWRTQPEVTIAQGVLRGRYSKTFKNRLIVSFESIPFAKPPLGELRFQEPVPADSWIGTLDATEPPPECIQYSLFIPKKDPLLGSEDCLYINVYTPQVPTTDELKLLDVIAFIHGGGFTMGSSWDHEPSLLLDRDFVLVTFNYRVGPIGFLSTEDSTVPGNNGLKDQALALKWIQQNIAAFGGNPKSVTLGGLSAGGASCSYQLLSPLSKGLFKGALCMSGVALNPWAMADNSREKAMTLASYLNCPTDDSVTMIECLKTKPAEDIVMLVKKFAYYDSFPFAPFGPVVEPISKNAFISDSLLNIIKTKKGSDVPVIFSYGLDEGAAFLINPTYLHALKQHSTDGFESVLDYNYTVQIDKRTEIRKQIKEFYKMNNEADIQAYVNVLGDRLFVAGISKLVKVTAAHYTSPVYVYRFSYAGEINAFDIKKFHGIPNKRFEKYPKGTHGSDAPYTIGMSLFGKAETEPDIQLTKEMQDMWVSFASSGKLEGNWQPVQEQLPKIVFTDIRGPGDFRLTVEDELGEESFWDSLGLNENIEEAAASHDEL